MSVDKHSLMEHQLLIEEEALTASSRKAENIISSAINRGDVDRLPEGNMILKLSIDLVEAKLKELFGRTQTMSRHLNEYHNRFDTLAYILIVTILKEMTRQGSAPSLQVIRACSKAVAMGLGEIRLKSRNDNLDEYMKQRYKSWNNSRRKTEKAKIVKHLDLMRKGDIEGPQIARFTSHMIDAVLTSGANIFEKKMIYRNKKNYSVITLTPEGLRLVTSSRDWFKKSLVVNPPLIVPPKPWENQMGTGGYYTIPKDRLCNSFKMGAIKRNIKSGVDNTRLLTRYFDNNPEIKEGVLGGLNKLAATRWRINKSVLGVMDRVFRDNVLDPNAPPKAPRLVGKLPVSEALNAKDYCSPEDVGGKKQPDGKYIFPQGKRDGWREFFIIRDAIRDHVETSKAKALSLALAMSVARSYAEYEEIYFSYQYDFRGRVYPIQSHLSPIGNDAAKALLQFAEGHPLANEEAVFWFKVHGANTYGFDKLPFEERITKITQMHDDILAIANDPMRNRHIWNDAEEPWMFLSWCFEYAQWDADKDHPVRTAVALDASCSGIQIYSGLLRDGEGAEAVNVAGCDRSDIYQQVADRVNEILTSGDYPKEITYSQSDGSHHTESTRALADSLKGKITRAIVKQPVMTTPYSVSSRGIKMQLTNRLTEIENENGRFWVGDNWKAALFLTGLVSESIKDVVKGARVGQEYLKQFARDIGKKQLHIFYNSPLTGFPVLLSTRQHKVRKIATIIGRFDHKIPTDKLDVRKLANGIAPNYIHSLDSALLMTVAHRLHEAGVTDTHFIHDSFGVHPNNTALLNKIVREVFVELFESDPLGDFVKQTWPDYEHRPEDIMLNTLDLQDVYDSKYLFS